MVIAGAQKSIEAADAARCCSMAEKVTTASAAAQAQHKIREYRAPTAGKEASSSRSTPGRRTYARPA